MSVVLEAQLVASKDMMDLGEAMCLAGSSLLQTGYEVMRQNELPTEEKLRQAEASAVNILAAARAVRGWKSSLDRARYEADWGTVQ